jgi:hypothetical protein
VAFAVFLFGLKVPAPPVQPPPANAFAFSVTELVPQPIWSGPAFAVRAVLIVIVMASDADVQGPPLSGSGIFHVSVIAEPISEELGV